MWKHVIVWALLFGAIFHVSEGWADAILALVAGDAGHQSLLHHLVMVLATVHIIQHE